MEDLQACAAVGGPGVDPDHAGVIISSSLGIPQDPPGGAGSTTGEREDETNVLPS